MTEDQKYSLLTALAAQHAEIVSECLRQADSPSKVVPDSVKSYTETFMNKMIELVKAFNSVPK